MSTARRIGVAIALCAAGGALLLVSASTSWVRVSWRQDVQTPTGPGVVAQDHSVNGATAFAAVSVLAVVALAGAGALPATRGPARTAVALALVAVGLTGAVGSGRVVTDPRAGVPATVGPGVEVPEGARTDARAGGYVAVAGSVLVAAGALVMVGSRRSPALSSRYDSPRAGGPPGDDAWAALDRGDDPTA